MNDRKRLVYKLRTHLLRRGLPRLEMAVMVAATGLAGFAASAVLLAVGITSMAIRYPAAVFLAYLVFLAFLRLLVEYHRRRHTLDPDPEEPAFDISHEIGTADPEAWSGGGGGSGG